MANVAGFTFVKLKILWHRMLKPQRRIGGVDDEDLFSTEMGPGQGGGKTIYTEGPNLT